MMDFVLPRSWYAKVFARLRASLAIAADQPPPPAFDANNQDTKGPSQASRLRALVVSPAGQDACAHAARLYPSVNG
jgi:hypothetical protein